MQNQRKVLSVQDFYYAACFVCLCTRCVFLDPKASLNAALVVVVVVVISSLKITKAFLIRSGAQGNFAHTFVLTFPTDIPSQNFKLFSS